MPIETINFISDMNVSNPVGASDPKSEGDNHLRNMKTGLKATLLNASVPMLLRPIVATFTDGNTLLLATTPAPAAYVDGMVVTFRYPAATFNTGAVTLNWDSLGAKALVDEEGLALEQDDLAPGMTIQAVYESTNNSFRVVKGLSRTKVGEVKMMGAAGVSLGFLPFDNAAVSRTTYARLF